ncbi:MAG: type III-A CRISPR-associated RAMP protein Csm5 [Saprospirales bacterium]|nr:type III-A CRISPR-associated RAMP protein Csm5 [Saprospirales bacterium]
MNNNFTIKILTPVHIGSGESAMKNVDFLYFSTEGKAAVLDQKKVLSVIGESNIDQWVSCVEKEEGLEQLLRQYQPAFQVDDVALRILPVRHGGLDKKKDVKEQLHDGFGKALLPGSSLKGSIRTALFTHFHQCQEWGRR